MEFLRTQPNSIKSWLRPWLYFVMFVLSNSSAYAFSDRELKIEAAYIYNFFNYITFPSHNSPGDKQDATICLYQRKDLLPYLEYVRSRKQAERNLIIRIVQDTNLSNCDMLYIGATAAFQSMLEAANQQQILTVGMSEDFLQEGGMIELHHQQERIAMLINKTLIEKYGYSISSRLLALAKEVRS